MLRMAADPSAIHRVLDARELVDAECSKVVSYCDHCPGFVAVDGVDVGSVSTERENTGDFPAELAGGSFPDIWGSQNLLSLLELLTLNDIVELFGVSLIDSSEVLGILGPVHTHDGRRVDELDGIVHGVLALEADSVNINTIVVSTNSQKLVIWGVFHDLSPLFWVK